VKFRESTCLNTPVEAFELEYPMRVTRCGLLYESGGAGENREGTPEPAQR
jgi:N-methylhydantoinase B